MPRSRWGLGQRTDSAPTFEGVLRRDEPRSSFPTFEPATDQKYPPTGESNPNGAVHDLHRLMVPRLLHSQLGDKVSPAEIQRRADHVIANATDTQSLHKLITEQIDK